MRVIAIVNQKGGCGKTTTTVNLAGALAEEGHRVLVVDMDPQAHATLALGLEPDDLETNLYEVLVEPTGSGRLDSIIVDVSESIDLAPSSIVLSALEQKLASERHDARTERLAAAIEGLPPLYDFVLIDCPPNVGLLTFNALRAAREVIIPLETSFSRSTASRRCSRPSACSPIGSVTGSTSASCRLSTTAARAMRATRSARSASSSRSSASTRSSV